MYLKGKIFKEGRFWIIEVPILNITTEGYSKKDAYNMMRDAVESLVSKKSFKTEVIDLTNNEFLLGSNDCETLISFMLKQQRHKHNLSLSDMADRIGASSKNAYAQYEQGKNLPSLTKLETFLEAMNEDAKLVFNVVEDEVKKVA